MIPINHTGQYIATAFAANHKPLHIAAIDLPTENKIVIDDTGITASQGNILAQKPAICIR
jgi:hypothetical protein